MTTKWNVDLTCLVFFLPSWCSHLLIWEKHVSAPKVRLPSIKGIAVTVVLLRVLFDQLIAPLSSVPLSEIAEDGLQKSFLINRSLIYWCQWIHYLQFRLLSLFFLRFDHFNVDRRKHERFFLLFLLGYWFLVSNGRHWPRSRFLVRRVLS